MVILVLTFSEVEQAGELEQEQRIVSQPKKYFIVKSIKENNVSGNVSNRNLKRSAAKSVGKSGGKSVAENSSQTKLQSVGSKINPISDPTGPTWRKLEKVYMCSKCNQLFTSWDLFEGHMTMVHKMPKRDLLIQRLVRPGDKVQELNGIKYVVHKNVSGQVTYCLECLQGFVGRKDFVAHILDAHQGAFQKEWNVDTKLNELDTDLEIQTIENQILDSILVSGELDFEYSNEESTGEMNTTVVSGEDLPVESVVSIESTESGTITDQDQVKLDRIRNIMEADNSTKRSADNISKTSETFVENRNANQGTLAQKSIASGNLGPGVLKLTGAQKLKLIFPCRKCSLNFPSRITYQNHSCMRKEAALSVNPSVFKKAVELAKQRNARQKNVNNGGTVQKNADDGGGVRKNLEDGRVRKRFACDLCKSTFSDKRVLNRHRRTHGPPSFVCQYCGFQCHFEPDYMRHIDRKHLNHRPFSCTICCRKFFDKTSLRDHLTIHSSEKKFECVECEKKFRTKSMLQSHGRVHQPGSENRFSCSLCLKRFRYSCNMRAHLRNVHHVK